MEQTRQTATDLKPGDQFKWSPSQRNWRTVQSIRVLEAGTFRGPAEFTGHIVVNMPYCKQVTLGPTHPVLIIPAP